MKLVAHLALERKRKISMKLVEGKRNISRVIV